QRHVGVCDETSHQRVGQTRGQATGKGNERKKTCMKRLIDWFIGHAFSKKFHRFLSNKLQIPSSKHQRNSKRQASNRFFSAMWSVRLEHWQKAFGDWCLELIWCLVFGAWDFFRHALPKLQRGLHLDP